ncbi:MAG: hypothetical protein AAF639_24960 [Chloroflexota bacterium]
MGKKKKSKGTRRDYLMRFRVNGKFQFYSHEDIYGDKDAKLDFVFLHPKGDPEIDDWWKTLPDGIQQTTAYHVLIDLARESETDIPFVRLITSSMMYRSQRDLDVDDTEQILMFAEFPNEQLMDEFEYYPTKRPGVYKSKSTIFRYVTVIDLNKLTNAKHNVRMKMMAESQEERRAAYRVLARMGFPDYTPEMRAYVARIAALTTDEMYKNRSDSIQEVLTETLRGVPGKEGIEPFSDITPEELMAQVEAFLLENG